MSASDPGPLASNTLRMQPAIGIDFGTTNSSVALASGDPSSPRVDLVSFPSPGTSPTHSFRSILYLEQHRTRSRSTIESFTGPTAIHRYLNRYEHAGPETGFEARPGRLIQSLKSYLPVRNLTGAEVFGRRLSLEDLIGRIVTDLRLATETRLGHTLTPETRVVVGRPVRFVSAETAEDDAFAVSRLTEAFQAAGLPDVIFLPEPVAAAFSYESTLTSDELILIGDFGGGTSDLSLVRVGPSARSLPPADRILGTAGLGLAGDAFDAKLVRHLVSPALGSDAVTFSLGKSLPAVPAWIYANLERWHYLSFLRTRNVDEILRSARLRAAKDSETAAALDALSTLIDEDLGYQLHQAVQHTKIALSHGTHAEFRFRDSALDLRTPITRETFESWIAPELAEIEQTVETLLTETGTSAREVDRVFLTGGTSFVPAVRRIFDSRFFPERVTAGEAFTSVAQGLALHAHTLAR